MFKVPVNTEFTNTMNMDIFVVVINSSLLS